MKITLPFRHFYYLNVLSLLRRSTHQGAVDYLFKNVEENNHNWIDSRYAHLNKPPKEIEIGTLNIRIESLIKRIQGLPPEIRPITDGPYCLDVRFDEDQDYIMLHLLGYKFFDFREHRNLERVSRIFPLVQDKFPFPLSLNEYGVYRDAGSQFWRLIQESERETMPEIGETAMDVGAHIGYRALAMRHCVGSSGKVYAIEVEDENFALLKKNIEANDFKNVIPIQEAVDTYSRTAVLYSRDKKSMAHGLRKFEDIEDPSAIDRRNNQSNYTKTVETISLDELFQKYQIKNVDNMHISVTGHEIEVLKGANSILPHLRRVRISCPYKTNGIPNIDTAEAILIEKGFTGIIRSGSAIIANRKVLQPLE